jgi:hypothetical protein
MKRTVVVVSVFVAAILAGLVFDMLVRPLPPVAREESPTEAKETFMQREVGMPLDMQASAGVTGFAATSPLLGSEPKPVPLKPYDMSNDTELFQFQDNRVSSDCCPSPFSTDRGCLCLTDSQIKQFESRGGNRA